MIPERILAVARMQRYIAEHLDEEICLADLGNVAQYSMFHAARIFREEVGVTPFEAIRAMRLTRAARDLQASGQRVSDIAVGSGFGSLDGFTRAFVRRFSITPSAYRDEVPPVKWFISYPVEDYYRLKVPDAHRRLERSEQDPGAKEREENGFMEKMDRTMTVTAVERPARKLLLMRAKKATAEQGYLAVAEELGCDWEGYVNSIPERLQEAGLMSLSGALLVDGATDAAVGTELPLDYDKKIPEGFEVLTLPPVTMLFFQGAAYENEEDFCEAIGILWELMDAYDPSLYGWEYASELAPCYNFGASAKSGALMARPVKRISR